MTLLAVLVLAAWAAATSAALARRHPLPTVAPQAPLGPMTPTFAACSAPRERVYTRAA